MNFEQFIREVKKEVQQLVGDQYSVSVNCVLKINRELQGISIRPLNADTAPSVYLEDYYTEFQNGKEISQIAKEIVDLSNRRKLNVHIIMENLLDYEWVKQRLRVKLINYERNMKLLRSVPHEKMLDLAVVPFILLSKGAEIMSITVNNQLLNGWEISKDEMLKRAKENTMKMEPVIVEKMTDVILRMILNEFRSMASEGKECEKEEFLNGIIGTNTGRNEMYILTNQDKCNGAFSAFQTKNLSDLADHIGVDKLYILPSSIHEAIVVPANGIDGNQLEEMVYSVNRTEVNAEDFLSDEVYVFSKGKENPPVIVRYRQNN